LIFLILDIFHKSLSDFKKISENIAGSELNKWLIPLSILILVYILGMLMDKIWHVITEKLREPYVKWLWEKYEAKANKAKLKNGIGFKIYSAENEIYGADGLRNRIYRRRGRIRILRASVCHILLLIIVLSIYFSAGQVVVPGILVWLLFLWAYEAVNREYLKMLVFHHASKNVAGEDKKSISC
ncbi:MAG TPA: hypothetical protein VJY62_06910, partial [Bacteroidia bacterium]|nr:hypothetical protein [Bacteroidia bacterium]